jgi:hypothetical protein
MESKPYGLFIIFGVLPANWYNFQHTVGGFGVVR